VVYMSYYPTISFILIKTLIEVGELGLRLKADLISNITQSRKVWLKYG